MYCGLLPKAVGGKHLTFGWGGYKGKMGSQTPCKYPLAPFSSSLPITSSKKTKFLIKYYGKVASCHVLNPLPPTNQTNPTRMAHNMTGIRSKY